MNQYFGKLLFPRLPPDVQRRKFNIILAVIVISVLLGSCIGTVIILRNTIGLH